MNKRIQKILNDVNSDFKHENPLKKEKESDAMIIQADKVNELLYKIKDDYNKNINKEK